MNLSQKHPLIEDFALPIPAWAFQEIFEKYGKTFHDVIISVHNSFHRHTLICHPVDYHSDFSQMTSTVWKTKYTSWLRIFKKKYCSNGRVVESSGTFVFSILDWEGYQRNCRSTYIAITGDIDPSHNYGIFVVVSYSLK